MDSKIDINLRTIANLKKANHFPKFSSDSFLLLKNFNSSSKCVQSRFVLCNDSSKVLLVPKRYDFLFY